MDVIVPLELEAGAAAEALNAWATAHQLVLDFASPLDEDRLLVSTRLRLPATAALDVRDALDGAIRDYELRYGEIHRPRRRGET